MKIKLRDKITKEEFFKEWHIATFVDYYGEVTYFKELKSKIKGDEK